MRKSAALLVVAIVLVLGVGLGWRWWTTWRFQQSTDDAYVQSDITVISPKLEGYIKEVRFEDNQAVAAGQVLFVIDDRDFAAKVAQAEAAVATAEAAVDTYNSRLDLQRSLIEQSRAEVAAAEADQVRADRHFQRNTQLAATDFASRQRLETAEAESRKMAATVAQRKAALTAARDQLNVLRAQRDEEKAKREQARANLRLAKNDLDNTLIRAPIAGVVGNRAGRTGQYVKPGTQLVSLVPLPYVYVTANFKETQLTRMRLGQPVEIHVDAYPEKILTGRIESFSPASGAQFSLLPPDNATGNFTKIVQRVPVRIALPADEPLTRLLRPGLSVTATVDTRAEPDHRAATIGQARAHPATPPTAPAAETQ
jgi:membrane fusion protein (multidrug efflux system)